MEVFVSKQSINPVTGAAQRQFPNRPRGLDERHAGDWNVLLLFKAPTAISISSSTFLRL